MFKLVLGTSMLLGSLSLFGCGGSQAQPETPAGEKREEAAETAPAEAAPATWAEAKTKEQKAAFMKANVQPRMAAVFQAADPEHYKDFGCKNCHGPNWKLPKDFLPELTVKDGKLTAMEEKPAVAKFMAEKVVPEMASIVGMQPYNPETKEGFGCMGCHKVNMQ